MPHLDFILPGPIGTLSGGFLYDRRVIEGLAGLETDGEPWAVRPFELNGAFPFPDAAARAAAAEIFAGLPEATVTVVDGLALGALPEAAARHGERLRLIALVHHPLAEETGLDETQRGQLVESETAALASVRGAIVTSPHTATSLPAYGIAPERIRVVTPGVDPAPIARGSGADTTVHLLIVGSVIPRKGHIDLIEALGQLASLDWRLTCVGATDRDPDTFDRLQKHVSDLRMGSRISFLGEMPPENLDEHYDRADLFVLPSYHEGYGMVLSEALARGLPIVSTTAGAIPDTVPADAGMLVPAGSPEALAVELRRMILHKPLRERLAHGARKARAHLVDWNKTAESFARAVTELAR